MADQKITQFSQTTTPSFTDILPIVINPGSTPANDKVTVADLLALIAPAGTIHPFSGRVAPTGFLNCDGSVVSRTTYATLFAALARSLGAVTITNASPAVVTNTAHGLSTGDAIYLTTTSSLPTGLSVNTLYYVIRIDANSYNLATSRANAYAATKINTSSAGSGTHTAQDCPYGLGDGSTTFTLPDLRGRVIAGVDTTDGTAANRLKLTQSQGVYGNLGASGGEEGHTIVTAEMASHTHTLPYGTALGGVANAVPQGNNNIGSATTSSAGSDTAHNNVQPVQLLNYIIKT